MKFLPSTSLARLLRTGVLSTGLALTSLIALQAEDAPKASPSTNGVPVVTGSKTITVKQHGMTITTDSDDEDALPGDKGHSASISINGSNSDGSFDSSDLVPILGVVGTFGTIVLVVFFVSYFKYKRRTENLALAREYLNKGVAVPTALLDESQREAVVPDLATRGMQDLRKGFKWTFVGFGVALALLINWPHSTMWGWGLIPMVIGIGFLISGALQTRLERTQPKPASTPPTSIEPPR